jgi:outer membrane protein
MVVYCVILGLIFAGGAVAADKVGYINLQRLVNESKMGKAARADIQKMRTGKQEDLNKRIQEINRLRDLLNKEGSNMDPRERRDKIEILKRAYKEYERLLADAKEDITREDRELVAIILQKADGVLKKVAKKNNYAIILKDPNAIGFLDPEVDITDLVLKELNKK